MSSLFTKIIQGEIPCHKVFETDTCFAFMDIRPVQNGHVLVVPKVEVDRFFRPKFQPIGRYHGICTASCWWD